MGDPSRAARASTRKGNHGTMGPPLRELGGASSRASLLRAVSPQNAAVSNSEVLRDREALRKALASVATLKGELGALKQQVASLEHEREEMKRKMAAAGAPSFGASPRLRLQVAPSTGRSVHKEARVQRSLPSASGPANGHSRSSPRLHTVLSTTSPRAASPGRASPRRIHRDSPTTPASLPTSPVVSRAGSPARRSSPKRKRSRSPQAREAFAYSSSHTWEAPSHAWESRSASPPRRSGSVSPPRSSVNSPPRSPRKPRSPPQSPRIQKRIPAATPPLQHDSSGKLTATSRKSHFEAIPQVRSPEAGKHVPRLPVALASRGADTAKNTAENRSRPAKSSSAKFSSSSFFHTAINSANVSTELSGIDTSSESQVVATQTLRSSGVNSLSHTPRDSRAEPLSNAPRDSRAKPLSARGSASSNKEKRPHTACSGTARGVEIQAPSSIRTCRGRSPKEQANAARRATARAGKLREDSNDSKDKLPSSSSMVPIPDNILRRNSKESAKVPHVDVSAPEVTGTEAVASGILI